MCFEHSIVTLNTEDVPGNNCREPNQSSSNVFGAHLEETPKLLKIILARAIITKFCQKDKDTPNQDRISPSKNASNKTLPVAITTAPITTPIAVEVFIGQTASAPEGIS